MTYLLNHYLPLAEHPYNHPVTSDITLDFLIVITFILKHG